MSKLIQIDEFTVHVVDTIPEHDEVRESVTLNDIDDKISQKQKYIQDKTEQDAIEAAISVTQLAQAQAEIDVLVIQKNDLIVQFPDLKPLPIIEPVVPVIPEVDSMMGIEL